MECWSAGVVPDHAPTTLQYSSTPSLRLSPTLLAQAQEKYRLTDASAVGDDSVVEQRLSMGLQLRGTVEGKKISRDMAHRSEETYHEEVFHLDASEENFGLRRTYSLNREYDKDGPGAEKKKVSSLEGKLVEIRRANGKVTIVCPKGKIAEADRKELAEHMSHPDPKFFPDREVGPGDEWAVDAKSAASFFEGAESANILCRFEGVEEHAGHKCARLRVTMSMDGQPEGMPVPMTMKLAGDMFYALDLQRPLSLELNGTVSIKSDGLGGVPGSNTLQASGPMKMSMKTRWIKVAGKPVTAATTGTPR
jgi:hypothetical protein